MNYQPDATGHTRRDADALIAAGIDPSTTQPRERVVLCVCGAPTWHLAARCDAHYAEPHAARRALAVAS